MIQSRVEFRFVIMVISMRREHSNKGCSQTFENAAHVVFKNVTSLTQP